jgi:hypothetical protein
MTTRRHAHRSGSRAYGSVRRATHRAIRETLEQRSLLSATLSNGVLAVAGTDGADSVTVFAHPVLINLLNVDVNGSVQAFVVGDVKQLSIATGSGNDVVRIDGSLDVLRLRSDVDLGNGNDRFYGGAGADYVSGGRGNDRIYTAGADDVISGGAGHDLIASGRGNDIVNGDAGRDSIDGGEQADSLFGGADDDVIDGAKGDDRLFGDDGDDQLRDRYGANLLRGGAGDDRIDAAGPGANWKITRNKSITGVVATGDDGNDTIRTTGANAGKVYGGAGNDDIENLAGEAHGDDGDDRITAIRGFGDDGSDLVIGTDGYDALYGGPGNDAIYGGNGDDTLYGEAGDDNLYAGGVDDADRTDDGRDSAIGGDGRDWFDPRANWFYTDRASDDSTRQVNVRNDPSYGSLTLSGGTLTANFRGTLDLGAGSGLTASIININASGMVLTGNVPEASYSPMPTKATRDIGTAAVLSGAYAGDDSLRGTAAADSPVPLSTAQRRALSPQIVAMPSDWQLEKHSTARDGVVWYRVWQKGDVAALDAEHMAISSLELSDRDTTRYVVPVNGLVLNSGGLTLSGGGLGNSSASITRVIPVSGAFEVGFVAFDEASLIVSGKVLNNATWKWATAPLGAGVLPLPSGAFIRRGAEGVAYQLATPVGNRVATVSAPWKGARGIYATRGGADFAFWFDSNGTSGAVAI